jgi:hypothetical protein
MRTTGSVSSSRGASVAVRLRFAFVAMNRESRCWSIQLAAEAVAVSVFSISFVRRTASRAGAAQAPETGARQGAMRKG